jgi:nitrogen fixation/metabolism regulation signal transduction histidine kinase
MKLSWRLSLLMVLLTLLPALSAGWITRQLIGQSLDLSLNSQIDGALEAGVRRARGDLAARRRILAADLQAWANGEATDPAAWNADQIGPALGPDTELLLVAENGERIVLNAGQGLTASEAATAQQPGEPPRLISETLTLDDGWRVEARRPLPESWRADAADLAGTLQVMRGLQHERVQLERGFWLPFLSIYGSALLIGLIVAMKLGRGITVPVQRLLSATKAVASGSWDIVVPVTAKDELGSLTGHFNSMVGTLDAQNRQLVDLEKMAGWREMARALAHEVKNPLTPIQLTVEEMRERYRGDDEEYKTLLNDCTRIVVEEVASLRNVVERFREFSRPVEPRLGPVDINVLLSDVGALQKDLQVDLDLDPQLSEIEADADSLRQVLMNLAQNARSATQGVEQPRLCLGSRLQGDRAVLMIDDNGPGIPPADRAQVFEPYRSGTAGGLGLGLALVKGIVLAHQGQVSVEEADLGGARLKLELPLRRRKDTSENMEQNEEMSDG